MIQTSDSTISYAGNNSIVTPYPVPFRFFDEADLVVVVKDELNMEDIQSLGADYSVVGANDPAGGNVIFSWPVPATSQVTIYRSIEATQLTSYEEADAFPAKSHERALDKLTCLVQQLSRGIGPVNELGTAFRLTEASEGINAVSKVNDSALGIDGFGNAVLRTSGETVEWLGQVGTSWVDTAERLVTVPTYVGQLGFQQDIKAIFHAISLAPGAWAPYFFGEGIVISEATGAPGVILRPEGDIVGTTEAQALYNKTLDHPAIVAPTGITKADVGLGNVDNTQDSLKPVSGPQAAVMSGLQSISEKGATNGYSSLDASGKIPVTQIPDAVLGASQYKGTWNATTNSPTIPAAATGNTGWYYSVSVAGSSNPPGASLAPWAVGDQVISNGSAWQKIPNVSAVNSVNGETGAVIIDKVDIGLPLVDNTSDAQKNSAVATLTNKTIAGANNTLTVRLENDVTGNLPVARLNAGTGATGATWWCGDGTWKQPIGAGDVVGPALSADNDVALFSGLTGKIIKSGGKPLSNFIEGPATAVADHIPQFSGTTGKLLKDGKAAPSGIIVGDTDTQTLTNKTLVNPVINNTGSLYRPSGILISEPNGVNGANGVNTVVWSYVLPAGLMSKDGDMLRITFTHQTSAVAALKRIQILMDAAIVVDVTSSGAAIVLFQSVAFMTRNTQTSQKWQYYRVNDSNVCTTELSTNTTADLGTPVTISMRVYGASATATCLHRFSFMEFLPVP